MTDVNPSSSRPLEIDHADGPTVNSWKAFGHSVIAKTVFWVALVEIGLIVLFGFLSPNHVFWTSGSFQNISLDAAEIVPLACVLALLLGAGELDISVGANIILASVLGGKVMLDITSPTLNQLANGVFPHVLLAVILGLLTCLAAGMAVGAINGLIITRLHVNSFIATLAMLGAATGVAEIITNDSDLANIPTPLQTDFGVGRIGSLPYPALSAVLIAVVLWITVLKTRFGMHTVALGSSREAARRAGLKVERAITARFILVGLVAGYAGFIDLSRFATTNIGGHQTDALAAIAAAVIGGTKLFGGGISIPGAVIGALLAVILQNGLVLIGLQNYYQLIAVAVVLVGAVYIDQRNTRAST